MSDAFYYLDHAATTPLRPEVQEAMAPHMAGVFGNPSSTHRFGREARAALEQARERVAAAIGAARGEIVFTAGGTEADNLAVLGLSRAAGAGLIAISAVEHSAVRQACAQAAREGADVVTLGVDAGGRVDVGALEELLIGAEPTMVSVMWANNELGTVQPVEDVGRLCREKGVPFHTDAVQAVGHIPISVQRAGCDLLALSAHKFGGPRGVGALFVRDGTALQPLVHGGGQEAGLRAGTSNVAGAVGLATALELAVESLETEHTRLGELRDHLQSRLVRSAEGLEVNADGVDRLPHLLSVNVPGVEPDVLLPALDLAGLAVSSGSACQSGAGSPSHVLVAIGRAQDTAIRFSLGWTTTAEDVDRAASIFLDAVGRARGVMAGGAA